MSLVRNLIKEYKPYRYTIKGKASLLESTLGKIVIKKSDKDIFSLFNYLESRGFNNMPSLIKFKNDEYAYDFLQDTQGYNEQKLLDLEKIISSLHNKTVYFKEASKDKYKEIRENILSNIAYLDNSFNTLFIKLLYKEYHSPSEQLFLLNYYKINEALKFSKNQIDEWYEIVMDLDKQRVATVHNNLYLDHYIRSEKDALISWENYTIDTPILDFYHLFQNEYLNFDFRDFLDNYLKHFELLEHEKLLLFSLISLPQYTIEIKDDYLSYVKLKEKIDYVFIAEKLIAPYVSKKKEE